LDIKFATGITNPMPIISKKLAIKIKTKIKKKFFFNFLSNKKDSLFKKDI
jgi:hypothetical protein